MFRIKDHHLHLPHITFDDSRNLKMLYAIRVSRDFGNKMAMFFLPVYLFIIGSTSSSLSWLHTSSFQRGMILLSLFYIVYGIIAFFMGIVVGRLYHKIGYQKTFSYSFLLRALFFAFIFFARENIWMLIPAVIFDAVNSQLFWPGYYSIISKDSLKKNLGKDVGLVNTLIHIASIISPAISGFIAIMAGLEVLFLIGLVLTLFSIFFVFEMDKKYSTNWVTYKEFFDWLKEKSFRKLAASYAGKYFYDVAIYIWPLYIFLLLGSVDKVGYLYTVSLFLAMLITYFTGIYVDSHKSKKPFYFSGGLLSILTALRTQVGTITAIALVDTFDKLISNIYNVYFDTIFILRSKGHSTDSYFIYREMIVNTSIVIFWTLTLFFFIFFSGWKALYIFASIGVLIGLLIRESKHE